MRILALLVMLVVVSGCYQVHSDDELRGVPVTNNPHLIPGDGGKMNRFTAMTP